MDDAMETPELYMGDMEMDLETIEMYTGDMVDAGTTAGSTADMAVVGGIMLVWTIIMVGLLAIMIVSMWKIFTKAGEEGWKSLIPFYNTWVMLELVGKPGWWLIWFFIPIANVVIMIMMYDALSKAFGKGIGYTLGLIFLSPIFFPMLAFGSATYTKPNGNSSGTVVPPQDQNPTM